MIHMSHLSAWRRQILLILLVVGILIVGLSIWPAPVSKASGTTYYVSSSSGNDSNSGTS
jgi:hypothetical protein